MYLVNGNMAISFYENYAREHGCRELRIERGQLRNCIRLIWKLFIVMQENNVYMLS